MESSHTPNIPSGPPPSYFIADEPDDQPHNEQQSSIQGSGEIVLSHDPSPSIESSSSVPFGAPPGYVASPLQVTPVVYAFVNYSYHSMLLLPPEDLADSCPQYHISVRLNCFRPTSHITTVARGASEDGEQVGEFDVGHSHNHWHGKVCLGGKEHLLEDVFVVNNGSSWKPVYDWKFDKNNPLRWQFKAKVKSTTLECKDFRRGITLANFYPLTTLQTPEDSPPPTQLEVLPEGQPRFDEILVSVLLLERVRDP